MLQYWIWLAQLAKLTNGEKWQLLQHFRDPQELYYSDEERLEEMDGITGAMKKALEDKQLDRAEQIIQLCRSEGIRLLTIGDEEYPSRLRNIFDPPLVLYYRGDLPDWKNMPVVGIVGTRRATTYGNKTAKRYAYQIAACGALVVSGAADGIDAAAMQAALDSGKPVVGVLGCGVDVIYPKKNKQLFERMLEGGCLISEFPPRTQAFAWNFPLRNRIISGMSNALLVVEAPENSGAMITARHAMEQGRDIYAVPGNVDSPTCAGSNALLREGATPALSGWDVVKEYASDFPGKIKKEEPPADEILVAQQPLLPENSRGKSFAPDKKSIDKIDNSTYSVVNKPVPALNCEEQEVLTRVDVEPKSVDALIDEIPLPSGTVRAVLTKLVVKGLVASHSGGRVSRK